METDNTKFSSGTDADSSARAVLDRWVSAANTIAAIISDKLTPAFNELGALADLLSGGDDPKLSYRQLQKLTAAERAEYARKRGLRHGKHYDGRLP